MVDFIISYNVGAYEFLIPTIPESFENNFYIMNRAIYTSVGKPNIMPGGPFLT